MHFVVFLFLYPVFFLLHLMLLEDGNGITRCLNTLKRVQARGKSPQNALPVLAAYMGHSEYKHTVKYLKMIDAKKRKQFLDFSLEQKEKR